MTTSGPAAVSSATSSALAARSVMIRSTSDTAAKEQNEFRPSFPEITGTIRRRADSSIARFAAASSGLVVVSPAAAVSPLTPMIARSTDQGAQPLLVAASTAAEVRPRIIPGSVITVSFDVCARYCAAGRLLVTTAT